MVWIGHLETASPTQPVPPFVLQMKRPDKTRFEVTFDHLVVPVIHEHGCGLSAAARLPVVPGLEKRPGVDPHVADGAGGQFHAQPVSVAPFDRVGAVQLNADACCSGAWISSALAGERNTR